MQRLFIKFGILTIAAVIILILVGGIVRATGSGMGCPDWPKCFGTWVPPTNIEQLPINYQEIYGAKLKGEVLFNPVKTWIEYLNRLVGVLIGILVFVTFVLSFLTYKKSHPSIVVLSFFAFILVGFEGWLGSKVVSSELHPLLVTAHMLVAIIILGILIFVILKSYDLEYFRDIQTFDSSISFLLMIGMILTIGQIVFGTQIREGIDVANRTLGETNRSKWIGTVANKAVIHAGLSFLILGLHFFTNRNIAKVKDKLTSKWSNMLLVFIVFSIITGACLGLFALPPIFQPLHLVFGVIIISLQFVLYFMVKPKAINYGSNS